MTNPNAFSDLRQNFASRPLFEGELGRDLDEMQRRQYASSQSAARASQGRGGDNNNYYSSGNPNNNNSGNNNNSSLPPQLAPFSPRAPLAEHHHIGSGGDGGAGVGNQTQNYQQYQQQQQQNYQNQYQQQQQQPQYNNNQQQIDQHGNPVQSPGSVSNNSNTPGGHGVRGPSQSGAWSLLPPQIPRPLGLQRFIDQSLVAPDVVSPNQQQQQNQNDALNRSPRGADSSSRGGGAGGTGRSSQATQGSHLKSSPGGKRNNNKRATSGSKRRGGNNNNNNFVGSSEEENEFDPIALGALKRRQEAQHDAMMHASGGTNVSDFAQSIGLGQAEAVAAKMAAEVANQATRKPQITGEDLHSNSSAGKGSENKMPRHSDVALMRRRLDKIDDGLARAAMRSQLASERLKNTAASGLVATSGSQTDVNMAPLETGEKRRPQNQFDSEAALAALVDPSQVNPASLGGSSAANAAAAVAAAGGAGGMGMGMMDDERDREAYQKMQRMKGESLVLMPAVPGFRHFKYNPPDITSALESKEKQDAKKPPAQAKGEARNALTSRLDQLELANEELLVRNRVIPTQPDQVGSSRPAANQPVDPSSVLGNMDPRDQFSSSPSGRVPQGQVVDKTIEHTANAYRLQHTNVAAPAGGYHSVSDPARYNNNDEAEAQRWAQAKARNEAEGMSLTTGNNGPLGASATAQLRTTQDDSAIIANASLRTLPQGNVRDNYDARKKWQGVSFEVPGTRFEGKALGEISQEANSLYGLDQQPGGGGGGVNASSAAAAAAGGYY